MKAVTQEASLLVTKAAELFLEALTAQALAADDAGGANPAVLTYADLGARVAANVVPVCMLRADASVARLPRQLPLCRRRTAWTF